MYHPYFRGKQNELITIRETAALMAGNGFIPVIEPVKETLGGLKRALDAVVAAKGQAIVIVNPFHGDLSSSGENLTALLAKHFAENEGISAGILLRGDMAISDVLKQCTDHDCHPITLIHAGFADARGLAEALGIGTSILRHVFFENYCGKLYQKHFKAAPNLILLRDGFQRRKNREHPEVELFSDLHVTYEDEGMTGFGDFLIVGDEYSESGGPAYAVAIHVTFIDHEQDDVMFTYHFVSDRQNSPTDPAGKFMEALEKLIARVNEPESKVLPTSAVEEFRKLHAEQHFPGLGYVKKLSMQHHIETLADYFGN